MQETETRTPVYAGSVIFWEDGSVTARYGYGHAVRRLYEYERSGVAPDGPGASQTKEGWERYTAKAPDGTIYPRRGYECILGRLFSYERSGLTPRKKKKKYSGPAAAVSRSR